MIEFPSDRTETSENGIFPSVSKEEYTREGPSSHLTQYIPLRLTKRKQTQGGRKTKTQRSCELLQEVIIHESKTQEEKKRIPWTIQASSRSLPAGFLQNKTTFKDVLQNISKSSPNLLNLNPNERFFPNVERQDLNSTLKSFQALHCVSPFTQSAERPKTQRNAFSSQNQKAKHRFNVSPKPPALDPERPLETNQMFPDQPSIERRRYGVGISGLDRLQMNKHSAKTKAVWVLCYLLLVCSAVYQISCCCYEFFCGKPAVAVEFSKRLYLPIPDMNICPIDFNWNPVTWQLQREYKSVFGLTDNEADRLVFSDFLALPGMNLSAIWNIYDFVPERMKVTYKCSTNKNDVDCLKNYFVTSVAGSSGMCLVLSTGKEIKTIGPLTSLQVILSEPINNPVKWYLIHPHMRIFTSVEYENSRYAELDTGNPAIIFLEASVALEITQFINLDLPVEPCEEALQVERCVNQCIEDLLFSRIQCRLPFMENSLLKDCDTPQLFNESLKITKEVMRKGEQCRKFCPRKCNDLDYTVFADFYRIGSPQFALNVRYFNTEVQVVREYQWYTASGLIADIGGSLGFFLDITFLTLIEVIEYLWVVVVEKFEKAKECVREKVNGTTTPLQIRNSPQQFEEPEMCISRRNRVRRKRVPENTLPDIKFGIPGFEIVVSERSSLRQRVVWGVSLILCTCLAITQIAVVVVDFVSGDLDIKLIAQRNDTIKIPALTFCPFLPFQYWDYIVQEKEQFAFDYNISDSEEVTLSELFMSPTSKVMEFWNESGVRKHHLNNFDIGCKELMQLTPSDEKYEVTITETLTVHGRCLTVTVGTPMRFRGSGTLVCVLMTNLATKKTHNILSMHVHSDEEDPRTLDPGLAIPLNNKKAGVISFSLRKIEKTNRWNRPCFDARTVAECRVKCFETIMGKNTVCRLPFMLDSKKAFCNDSHSFNISMESAFSFYKNYSQQNWCNCGRKCEEYMYVPNLDSVRLPLVTVVSFALQFPSSIIKVTKEYSQMTVHTLFANVCGSLGFFLGFNALSVLEMLESIVILVVRRYQSKAGIKTRE